MKTFSNLLAFSPELWLLAGAIAIVIAGRFSSLRTTTTVALVTLLLAFLALATQFKQTIVILDDAFRLDAYAIVIDVAILGAAALALLASAADLLPGEVERPTVPAFYLLATLGAMLAVSAGELLSLFVSLELLAVNLYVIAGLLRRGAGSAATSLGYALAGAVASGLLLYGLAIFFGLSGQVQLRPAAAALGGVKPNQAAVMLMLSLLIAGFSVRIGLAPIRWWLRGFENGVSLRAVLLVQSVGVVTGLAVFGRLLGMALTTTRIPYAPIFAGVAAIAMTAGTLLAITQSSLRRMLVYGTIAQSGFALAAFTDLQRVGLSALIIFLVAQALTTICAFAALIAYTRSVHSDAVRDLAGLSVATPAIALALALGLLSMAGVPPLAGFLGRLLILQATVDGGYAWLAVIGLANMLIGTLGIVRVIRILFIEPPVFEVVPARLDRGIRVAMGFACAGVVFMGLVLEPLYRAASHGQAAILH